MATTIEYNIKVNDAGATRTVNAIEDELEQVNSELKALDVNSDAFTKAAKKSQALTRELEQTELAIAGVTDEDKIRGFQGAIDVVGGSVAGLTGAIGLLGLESEEFEKFTAYAANAIAFSEGIRTAAQGLVDLREVMKKATAASNAFNLSLLKNPFVIVGAAIAALVAGIVEYTHRLTPAVSRTETFTNFLLSMGNASRFAALQAQSLADAQKEISTEEDNLRLERSIAVLTAFGQETVDLQIQLAEKQLEELEKGSEEYEDKLTEILVLRAQKTKKLEEDRATAEQDAYQAELARLQGEWELEQEAAGFRQEYYELFGKESAMSFTEAFNKTVEENVFDPDSVLVLDEFDPEDDPTFQALVKQGQQLRENNVEAKKQQLEIVDQERENWQSRFNIVSQGLDAIQQLQDSSFDLTMDRLSRERDEILGNTSLTQEEREKAIADIEAKEREAQIKKIKRDRDAFTIKQTLVAAELVLEATATAQKQILLAQLTAAEAVQAGKSIAITGAKEVGKASMSLGSFMAALGPLGIAAFGVAIVGVIASIVAARRAAKQQLSEVGVSSDVGNLGSVVATGGSSAPPPPPQDLVPTGISAEDVFNQQAPVRAYVLTGDVNSAEEADAKLNQRRTLG